MIVAIRGTSNLFSMHVQQSYVNTLYAVSVLVSVLIKWQNCYNCWPQYHLKVDLCVDCRRLQAILVRICRS